MKRKNALTFRIKCIAKKCRETGKWDLYSLDFVISIIG